MDDITIPPEALEEMLRSFGCECSSCQKAMKRVGLAMLRAWPGMKLNPSWELRTHKRSVEIILPLSKENNNAEV